MAYSRIEIPTLVRDPLPFGLVAVADDVTPGNDAWTGGFTWQTDVAPASRTWDPQAEVPEDKDFTLDHGAFGTWATSVLYNVYNCPSPPADDDLDRVRRHLETGSSHGAEAAFWNWAFNAATPVATGTASYVVAQLGQALSDDGLPTAGIVHMPAAAAEIYLGNSGFDASGERTPRTNRGDKISVGSGYPDVGAGDTQWIIASGPVGVALSSIETLESPEDVVRNNMRHLIAERYVGIQVDTSPLYKGLVTIA